MGGFMRLWVLGNYWQVNPPLQKYLSSFFLLPTVNPSTKFILSVAEGLRAAQSTVNSQQLLFANFNLVVCADAISGRSYFFFNALG